MKYKVNRKFIRHNRTYRPGEVRDFAEWPDNEREAEINLSAMRGEIEALPEPEDDDPPVPIFEDDES